MSWARYGRNDRLLMGDDCQAGLRSTRFIDRSHVEWVGLVLIVAADNRRPHQVAYIFTSYYSIEEAPLY